MKNRILHFFTYAVLMIALGASLAFPISLTIVDTSSVQTLTNKTLTAPVLGGTVTGTYTLAGTPTISSPTISGTVAGGASYTAPTLTSPTISGTLTGNVVQTGNIVNGTIADVDIDATGISTRTKIPSALAYEDEANTLTGINTFSAANSLVRKQAGDTVGMRLLRSSSVIQGLSLNLLDDLTAENTDVPSWDITFNLTTDSAAISRKAPNNGARANVVGWDNTGKQTVGTVPLARIDGFTGSSTVDIGSIAANTTVSTSITVTGAAGADFVMVSTSDGALSANIVLHARVTAANTVTVYLSNTSAGAIDPANANYYVKVIKKDF